MFMTIEVVAALIVALAMSLALAHALELPGKLRLSKEQYLMVQPIYYPGFTYGGMAEPLGLVLTLILALFEPFGRAKFWLALGGFLALAGMHASYWLLTHPVNGFWLQDVQMGAAGSGFFSFDPLRRTPEGNAPHWQALRDRWEFSHVIRAGFGLASLVLVLLALAH